MAEVIVYQAFNTELGHPFAYSAEQIQAAHNFSVIPLRETSERKFLGEAKVVSKTQRTAINMSLISLRLAQVLAIVGVALVSYTYSPSAWYWVQAKTASVQSSFALSAPEVRNLTADSTKHKAIYEPPFDAKLPIINHFTIPSIGVDTDIQEAELDNYQDAIRRGAWRVSDFGAPDEAGQPVILAAHRFGYLAWTSMFRYKNSFLNLPKVKVGDVVNIVWRQRKYTYEVYATQNGTEITDYSADLILYTCETLSGPERVFVYARLIQV